MTNLKMFFFFFNKNWSWVWIVFRMCFARFKESGKWCECLYNGIELELTGNKQIGLPWVRIVQSWLLHSLSRNTLIFVFRHCKSFQKYHKYRKKKFLQLLNDITVKPVLSGHPRVRLIQVWLQLTKKIHLTFRRRTLFKQMKTAS